MADVIELNLQMNGVAQTLSGVRGISSELQRTKEAAKRQSIENQQLRLAERLEVQKLIVAEKQRQVILRGTGGDVRSSLSAQNTLKAIERQQALVKQRLSNFNEEIAQSGTTGWESLRKILLGNIFPLFNSQLPGGLNKTLGGLSQVSGGASGLSTTLAKGLGAGSGSSLAVLGITSLIGVGLVGAIAAATSAMGFLVEQLVNTQTELDRISERTKLQSIFDTDKLGGIQLQQQNEDLVRQRVSPALSKEKVLALQTSFVDEFKDKNPDLSATDIFKRSIDIAQGFAAIQQTSKQDITQLRRNIDDIVSGTRSANQIDNLEFFTNLSPSQKKTFKKVYQDKGGLAALEAVANMSETILLIGESADSTQARFTKIQDDLFGARYGLFSVDRDLDLNKAGYQNIRSEFNRSLDLIFGKDGLFSSLGQILGTDGDVMMDVKMALTEFNNLLEAVNKTLSFFKPSKGYQDFTKERDQAFDQRRSQIEEGRKGTQLDKIMQQIPGARFGEFVALNILKGFRLIAPTSTPNYQGLIQSFQPAYNGFQKAYDTERRNKPPGTQVKLLYNTGEDILPPGKLKQYLNSAYQGGKSEQSRQTTIQIAPGAIVVHGAKEQNEGAIADLTLDRLLDKINGGMAKLL